jgi:L-aspartate oxidase
MVFGAHAGEGAAREAAHIADSLSALELHNPSAKPLLEPLDLADIRNSLKSLMWRHCGVRRDGDGLREAAENVEQWCRYVLGRQFADPLGWELQNMLCLSRLMIRAALAREETRGSHFRTDFPRTDDERWHRHLTFRKAEEG